MVDITNQIEQFFQNLCTELEKIAPSIKGTVSPGSIKFPEVGSALQVQFPGLKGTYNTHPVWITFSIASDFSRLLAGQEINKPTMTMMDYLNPWLQIYAYQKCPFVLWITHGKTDILTKILRALGLESKSLVLDWPKFDDCYMLDCRSGRAEAEAFLKMPGTKEKFENLGIIHLLSFEEAYIKLVTSGEESGAYGAERMLKHIMDLSGFADILRSVNK